MTPTMKGGLDRLLEPHRPRARAAEIPAPPDAGTASGPDAVSGTAPEVVSVAPVRSAFAGLMSRVERRDPPVRSVRPDPQHVMEAPVAHAESAGPQGAQEAREVSTTQGSGEDHGRTRGDASGAPLDLPTFLRVLPRAGADVAVAAARESAAADAIRRLSPSERGMEVTGSTMGRPTKDAPEGGLSGLPSSSGSLCLPSFLTSNAPAAVAAHGAHTAKPPRRPSSARGDALPEATGQPSIVLIDPAKPTESQPAAAKSGLAGGAGRAVSAAVAAAGQGASAVPSTAMPAADRLVAGDRAATHLGAARADTADLSPVSPRKPPKAKEGAERAVAGARGASHEIHRRAWHESLDAMSMPRPAPSDRADPMPRPVDMAAAPSVTAAAPSSAAAPSLMPDLASLQSPSVALPDRPIAATLPSLRQPVGTEAWQDELSAQLSFMTEQGDRSEAVMKLAPEELGELEIRLELRAGEASLQFGAAGVEARHALEIAQPRLREMFQSQGLNVTDFRVFSNLGGDPRSSSQQGEQSSSGRRGGQAMDVPIRVTPSVRRSQSVVDTYV